MSRLRGKIRKGRHRALKEDLRGVGWGFYLDKGMPWLYDFLARSGVVNLSSAELAGGYDAPDDAHLKLARKAGQIFVTRDEALLKKAQQELVGCPGILALRAHRGTNTDLLALFMAAVTALAQPEAFREKIVLASSGQLKVFELGGTTWALPAK